MIKDFNKLSYITIYVFLLLITVIILFYLNVNMNNCKCDTDIEFLLYNKQSNFNTDNSDYEYIIIGSGPAGLQTAYFLEKYNRKYIILEKNNCVGSFFKKYPIHRKLISVNKVHTGSDDKEFNLRHDWNSLLSDDDSLLFKNYSKEFFPKADTMVQYLDDFYRKNKLNISFNTNVKKINKNNNFEIITDNKTYKSPKLIISAGLFKSNKLNIDGSISYSDLTTDKSKFINKKIMIIGQGNSAFETADYLTDTASIIHIYGRGPLKFAWQTHYPGDLRAVNNNFLDTYQLKTQNGLNGYDETDIVIKKNGKYFVYDIEEKKYDNQTPNDGYDYVIDCTGFNIDMSIFGNINPDHNGKVPIIKSNFESINVNNLFFAGVLSQYISYKKSSGAFIHGFRYLVRSMINIQTNNLKTTIFNNKDFEGILNKILYRINNGSGIFQMFGCLVDVIIFHKNMIFYIEEIPNKLFLENYKNCCSKAIVISLNYGDFGGVIENTRSLGKASYVFGEDRAVGSNPNLSHLSNFLHPIFELYKNSKLNKKFHMSEHLMTEFKLKDVHIDPLKNFLKDTL